MVQSVYEARRELVENLGAFLSPQTAAQPPAHSAGARVLADGRAARAGTKQRNDGPAAVGLARECLGEGGERRLAGVVRQRDRVSQDAGAVRDGVADVA